jgi:hypothetical protein
LSVLRLLATAALLGCLAATACGAQDADGMAISADRELRRLAAELLPELALRSGLELRDPVRLERRSREHLVRYLESKLDEEFPDDEAQSMVEVYALLGLVPRGLDLRGMLLSLYTEQVSGFYEPDSTALFVMDDQPRTALQGLLVHELVHAIQDQNADLAALTRREIGNDRTIAAQAAIEGHATLVMLEYVTGHLLGTSVDLAEIPDFAAQMRPAIEAMRGQFPALAGAPRVVQESLLFPYLEGTRYVQALWAGGTRLAPFGEHLPLSTEQVLEGEGAGPPIELAVAVEGGLVVRDDVLGRLEAGILLEEHAGAAAGALADAWDGDRYVLVEGQGGGRGLLWYAVWEDEGSRDAIAEALERALSRLGPGAALERTVVSGRPATLLRAGILAGVTSEAVAADGT